MSEDVLVVVKETIHIPLEDIVTGTGQFRTRNIHKGIEAYQPANNRSQLIEKNSNTYILDAYNANPTSMQLAVESFAGIPHHNKIVILGDMLEMGTASFSEHTAITGLLKKYKFNNIILVGTEFEKVKNNINCIHFDDVISLKKWFKEQSFTGTCFLIKGSRKICLEKLLD